MTVMMVMARVKVAFPSFLTCERQEGEGKIGSREKK